MTSTQDRDPFVGFGPPPEPTDDPWDYGEPTAEDVAAFRLGEDVRRKAYELRVIDRARELLRREKAGPPVPFDAGLLADVLARPDHGRWRVDELLGVGGRLLVAAQRKTGKTTWALNLARDLVTGGQFLDRFDVDPVPGRVALLNYEVTPAQLARWGRDVGVPGDRLLLVNLRGCANPLRDDDGLARLSALLVEHDVDVVVVDPFGRAYTGASQNDSGEVGAWLVDLDRVMTDADVGELVLTAHAGWNGERTRGASALEDWADTVVTLTRDEDSGERFMRALGRDVEVDEDRLDYDPAARSLRLSGLGSRVATRAERRLDDLVTAVVEVVRVEPGATVARLTELLRADGHALQRGDAGKAARAAAERGLIRREAGKRNAVHHHPILSVVPSAPEPSPGRVVSGPDPSYMEGTTHSTTQSKSGPDVICSRCGDQLAEADVLAGSDVCSTCEVRP